MAQNGFQYCQRSNAGVARHGMDADGRAQWPSQRTPRPSPQRIAIDANNPFGCVIAIDATNLSGCVMVIDAIDGTATRQRTWDVAAQVVDPEIPVLTIADLGVLPDVSVSEGRDEVTVTPSYSGCPAMNMIALEIELALERVGFRNCKIRTVLSPGWT